MNNHFHTWTHYSFFMLLVVDQIKIMAKVVAHSKGYAGGKRHTKHERIKMEWKRGKEDLKL